VSQHREDRAKQIQESIREVLLHEWDPVGIRDVREAQGEYDGYVGGVYRLLAAGASEEQVVDYLCNIETLNMGLGPPDQVTLRAIARRLCGLEVKP
jgi:hypothetical protein